MFILYVFTYEISDWENPLFFLNSCRGKLSTIHSIFYREMTSSFTLLVGFLLVLSAHLIYGIGGSNEYAGKCEASVESVSMVLDCNVALFSTFTFAVHGPVNVLSSDLCEASAELGKYTNSIIAVKRGMCSFDQKSKVANLSRFKALIILNTDDSFPMGSSVSEYKSSIPVLMIKMHDVLEQSHVEVKLIYGM